MAGKSVTPWTLIEDVAGEITIPETGLATKKLIEQPGLRVMGFGFAAGHELKAHTAPHPVVLYFLEGEAEITLGEDTREVRAGAMVHIPARLVHSVRAKSPVRMALLLLLTAA